MSRSIKEALADMALKDSNKVCARDMKVGKFYTSTPVGWFWKDENGVIWYRPAIGPTEYPVNPHDSSQFVEHDEIVNCKQFEVGKKYRILPDQGITSLTSGYFEKEEDGTYVCYTQTVGRERLKKVLTKWMFEEIK